MLLNSGLNRPLSVGAMGPLGRLAKSDFARFFSIGCLRNKRILGPKVGIVAAIVENPEDF